MQEVNVSKSWKKVNKQKKYHIKGINGNETTVYTRELAHVVSKTNSLQNENLDLSSYNVRLY